MAGGFFGFSGMGFMGPNGPRFGTFEETFRCYSMVFFENAKAEEEYGGKIILPSSALEKLARLNISYPMLFRLSNTSLENPTHTHCGVLEFSAAEGRVYVPRWVLNQLCARDGDILQVTNVSLPLATFSKFQPQAVDFLDITNPKAVLELKLRQFACLTKGDIIQLKYNEKIYEMLVLETSPQDAVSIIECDMKVDFAAPVGYKEPQPEPMATDGVEDTDMAELEAAASSKFKSFSGQGQRLDGKKNSSHAQKQAQQEPTKRERGIPNYNYRKFKLTFAKAKNLRAAMEEPMEEAESGFTPFSGSGQKLKQSKKRTHPRS